MQLTIYDIAAIRGMILAGAGHEIIHLKTGYAVEDILKVALIFVCENN